MFKTIFTVFMFLNFSSYLWSVIGVFKNHGEKDNLNYRILQISSVSTWILCSLAILKSDLYDWAYQIGIIIQIFCLVTFWFHSNIVKKNSFSLAFSKDQPQRLVNLGFYKKIRHPFYMIYQLCYYSIAFLTNSPSVWISCVLMSWVYFNAAKFEEQKFASSPLAKDYEEYKKNTGMFFIKSI